MSVNLIASSELYAPHMLVATCVCVCVCVCVCAHVCAWVCVGVCAWVCACVSAHARTCMLDRFFQFRYASQTAAAAAAAACLLLLFVQAGQGGQVELAGVVSSRGAAREAAADAQDEQVLQPKRTSRRRLKRGSAALEGDQLSKSILEQTLKTDEAGNTFVDRATFGEGNSQWYGIMVSGDKPKEGMLGNLCCDVF